MVEILVRKSDGSRMIRMISCFKKTPALLPADPPHAIHPRIVIVPDLRFGKIEIPKHPHRTCSLRHIATKDRCEALQRPRRNGGRKRFDRFTRESVRFTF